MSARDSIVIRDADIAWRVIDGEVLAVNPKDNRIYPLENSAAKIWQLIDGSRTSGDIADMIIGEFEGDSETIEKDVLSFIEELITAGLVKRCE